MLNTLYNMSVHTTYACILQMHTYWSCIYYIYFRYYTNGIIKCEKNKKPQVQEFENFIINILLFHDFFGPVSSVNLLF